MTLPYPSPPPGFPINDQHLSLVNNYPPPPAAMLSLPTLVSPPSPVFLEPNRERLPLDDLARLFGVCVMTHAITVSTAEL